jgi:asparagine synthase (glutamine-hydrolysing)
VRLGDLHERPFSAELKARVAKAGDFLCQLEDERSGGVPCFGPNDGALVLPLNNCDYTDFRPVLQAIAVLSRGERRFRSGPWDEDLLWLFGPEALSAPVRPEERKSLVAAESGFYTLRGRESAAVLRCPRRFRHRPTQADLLHVDLWWRGLNVAADAGSFSYNAPPPWDHALGLTRFHNTVIVDEQDQMRRAGRFLWLPWAQGCVSGVTDGGKLRGWNATHDGYRRLKGKVAHRRRVEGLGGDTWCVLDSVAGEGTHRAMLHWLLADAPFAWEQPGRCLRLDTGEGPFFVCVLVWPGAGEVGLLRADPDSARGWRSRYYQHREPTLSLSVTVTGCGLRFATLFSSDRCLECTVDEAGVRVAAGRGAELLAWP